MAWSEGEIVVRREWRGSPWMAVSVIVVADEPELLATYLPRAREFAFPTGNTGSGHIRGTGRGAWKGHGVLMLQRPGERYAVWHFLGRCRAGVRGLVRQPAGAVSPHADRLRHLRPRARLWLPAAGGGPSRTTTCSTCAWAKGVHGRRGGGDPALGRDRAMLDRGAEWWDPAWSRWDAGSRLGGACPGAGWETATT
jgi:hypothetical protein